MAIKKTITAEIDLSDLDQDELREYIQSTNSPGEVFPQSELAEWATKNGFLVDPTYL